MARSDRERIRDILAAIADIRADTAGMGFDAFCRSPVVIRSVLFSLGVIGEAAKAHGTDVKSAHPSIPWRAVAGMRDRIVHEYFRTNIRRVWEVVEEDLDQLDRALQAALAGDTEPPLSH